MSPLETIWTKITDEIKSDKVNKHTSKVFLSSIKPSAIKGDELIMEASNEFSRHLMEEKYSTLLTRVLSNEEPALKFKFILGFGSDKRIQQPTLPDIMPEEPQIQKVVKTSKYDDMFNSKYTFNSFVVGESNKFAYAVCQSVSKNPGNLHNPVFIYGGSGLGKTHLMQAIGQELVKHNPKTKVSYLSSETFTNEFIDSLKDRKAEAFRSKYRKTDLLLIDDVQFFAGKEQTQEEFFHTFNELFQQQKQIVLTSDASPDKIQRLEERLASRFAMGVVIDIQLPNLELRAAILKKFASQSMVEVPDDVIMYLAQGVSSHVRALEGAFNSILAFAGIMNRPISKDLVDQVLKNILRENSGGKISISWIQKRVAEFYEMPVEELTGKGRSHNLVLPRQVAMRICQLMTESSLNQIGEKFGGRDHTTVIYGCNKINTMLKQDKSFAEEFERIKRFVDPDKQ